VRRERGRVGWVGLSWERKEGEERSGEREEGRGRGRERTAATTLCASSDLSGLEAEGYKEGKERGEQGGEKGEREGAQRT